MKTEIDYSALLNEMSADPDLEKNVEALFPGFHKGFQKGLQIPPPPPDSGIKAGNEFPSSFGAACGLSLDTSASSFSPAPPFFLARGRVFHFPAGLRGARMTRYSYRAALSAIIRPIMMPASV